jgi:hypothetical protein
MFSFFKKRSDDQLKTTVEAMQESLKKSFGNIKKDFSTIDTHHRDFHGRHEKHDEAHVEHRENIKLLSERLIALERSIAQLKNTEYEPIQVSEESELEFNEIESMTEVSQKICFILAALAQENKELVTLKSLAEEMYPDKEYSKIRSTISQYTTELEELGYVQKKKKGKNVYIKSTDKNPFLKDKSLLKKKNKAKLKHKV